MLLYWTNPFIVCDMCFPHPQTFALALFVITVALVMAHCRSLGPIVGALTVVIDPNLAVCVAAVSVCHRLFESR